MNEIIITEENQPTLNVQDALLKVVQRSDIDPERLEKFFDLQIKMENRQREQEFNEALSGFQGECPVIPKSKKVKFNTTSYEYAPLDEIVHIIKPFLSKYGLSYSFDTRSEGSTTTLITTIFHKGGHSKQYYYTFDSVGDGGQMNGQQRRKSAMTYAKRAGLENALGIVTAGEDDDARRSSETPASKIQIETIKELMPEAQVTLKMFMEKFGSDPENLSEKTAKAAINTLRTRKAALCSK